MKQEEEKWLQIEERYREIYLYFVSEIVRQVEKSGVQWKRGCTGKKSLDNKANQLNRKYLLSDVLEAVKYLEKKGILTVRWNPGYRGIDFRSVSYRLEDMPFFYKVYETWIDEDFRPRWYWTEQYVQFLEETISQTRKEWIRQYYEDLLSGALGQNPREKYETQLRYRDCFRGLDEQDEPILMRLFSKKYLGNTKAFKKDYCRYIISKAVRFCPDVDEDMDDSAVLAQINIEDYGQELMIKGPLRAAVETENGEIAYIDTEQWVYGAALSGATLKRVKEILKPQHLKRIVSIENKANFAAAPYRDDTLFLFSHGYFSPSERRFLQKMHESFADTDVEYFHSGDLDYGGVKIYQYIRKRIFPELMPLYMDVDIFEKYEAFAEEIEPRKLEKLKKLEDVQLQELIDKILETGKGIEQESFLICSSVHE